MIWMLIGSAVLGLGAGCLAPWLTKQLPEPPPRIESDSPSDAKADPPKVPYAQIARAGWFRWGAVGLGPVIAVGLALVLPGWWELGLWLLAMSPMLALAYIDARTKLLPTRLVLPTTAVVVGAALLTGWAGHRDDMVRGLIALLVARSFFWVMWFLRPAAFGFGDVRLVALLGFLLGIVGWREWFIGIYAGIALFAVLGLGHALRQRNRAVLKTAWPFGPALIVGAWCGPIITRLLAS